jgi:hypothetical protein
VSPWDQFVTSVQPSLITFLTIFVPAFLIWLGSIVQGWSNTNKANSARDNANSARDQIHSAADTGAKQVFALAPPDSNLQTKALSRNGDEVKDVAAWINGSGAAAAKATLGMSQADVNGVALAALGGQQIAAAAAAAPSTVIAPLAQPSTMDVFAGVNVNKSKGQ